MKKADGVLERGTKDTLFLVGDTRKTSFVNALRSHYVGRMILDATISPWRFEPWAFDNGAFIDWIRGRQFDECRYLRAMEKVERKLGTPLFAIVPDIVAGGLRSLDFSLSWRDRMPDNWSCYLALQDGMTFSDIESVIDRFDGLFLGGTDKFKSTAWRWRELAKENCKQFHYGRAGTPKKVLHARTIGADSADSAFPCWTTKRFELFLKLIECPLEIGLFK